MNTKQTLEAIAVMQAHTLGKTIQWDNGYDNSFEDCPCPEWDWDVYEYRVKPDATMNCLNCIVMAEQRDKAMRQYDELKEAANVLEAQLNQARDQASAQTKVSTKLAQENKQLHKDLEMCRHWYSEIQKDLENIVNTFS